MVPRRHDLAPASRPALVPDARRIAVLRASALGDFVFALPALAALRAAYPDAEIVLLARAWHADLLRSRPSPVDRVIPLPVPFVGDEGAAPDPVERRLTLDRIRRVPWDLAIQLHGGGRNSNPIVTALSARVTAGAATPDADPLDRTVPYRYWQHEVLRNLEIVALVGAPPIDVEPRLAVTDEDRAAAGAAIAAAGGGPVDGRRPADGRPLVVLHPGATDPRRRWPPTAFAAVGDALAAEGFRVAVTGTEAERDVVEAVLRALRRPALDLCGRLDLRALVGVLASSALVVANDTGPLHLAGAVGARSVGIYWCGNALNAAPPGRARHIPLIAWRLDCPTCGTDCIAGRCDHEDSFVADVPPEAALAAALELLGLEGAGTAAAAEAASSTAA